MLTLSGDLVLWLIWAIAISFSITMVYVAWRSLFHDRGAHLRRCPHCWHDLSHTPGLTCGECGHAVTSERMLQRTHRRPLRAMLSIIACVAMVGYLHSHTSTRGWASLVPTRLLIMTMPITIDEPGDLRWELFSRMRGGRLSQPQWKVIFANAAEGDFWRKPGDEEWANTYGDLILSWRERFPRGSAELEPLLAIPPRITLDSARAQWPAGSSPRLRLAADEWWPGDYRMRVHVIPRDPKVSPIVLEPTPVYAGTPYSIALPALPLGRHAPTFDITVERRSTAENAAWEEVLAQPITAAIEIVPATAGATAMTADESDLLTQAVAAALRGSVVAWPEGDSPVRVHIDHLATSNSAFADIAIGVRVEIQQDGVIARELHLWWMAGGTDELQYGYEIVHEDVERLLQVNEQDGRWTMRITSDRDLALRAGEAKRHWQGSLTHPLRVSHRNNAAPPPQWNVVEE